MPLDTSITNVGEYYSSHYLESTFTKDVKDLVAKWKEQGSDACPRRLQSLSQYYFRAKTQVLDEEEPLRRQFAGDEARGWHAQLLHALGYNELDPFDHPTEGGDTFVPTLGRVNRYNQPWLSVCETHFCLPDASLKEGMPSEDPLSMEPYKDQLQNQADHKLCAGDWSRCIGRIFTEEDAPRWILLLAGSQVLLLDRNTFAQGRFLSFDLDDAFGRKERDTFNHIAAFLSADTLCPDGESDEVLLDKLEEQSHKFAHGVTESLQFAVREAIEILVNEWARDRTEREKRPLLRISRDELKTTADASQINLPEIDDATYEITAEHLRREALTFVYRLLFCLYAEARGGELEILPVDDNIYRLGYSLESLRDLELVPLTDATRAGTYFHEHLKKLFQIIHNGFHPNDHAKKDAQPRFQFDGDLVRAFEVRPLTATLFAPDATPLLNRAELSNGCLQQVIRNLSLSTDKRSKTVGRVNYAELGINQLGAVYEGLLSYKGMFADQELIHVKPEKKDFDDKKTPTWFVPRERLEEFKKDEVERLADGKPRIYRKGEFILHLNGIDREQSASYYTPEVLTKCLVEEALRELLKDYTPDDADKILSLKICEPAMGSGAFLNEAAEQLATRYLELKQKQLQEKNPDGDVPVANLRLPDDQPLASPEGFVPTSIEPARFGDELRRVKHYIATNNIYGVDLNETAVELGQLSLWLGSIHRLLVKGGENGGRDVYQSGATPWFGLRLRCGNSLIGARRAVWTVDQLKRGEHAWKSKDIQQVQSDIVALRKQTTPESLANFRKESLDLVAKIKWDELAEDFVECREQVIRFCECVRERNTTGLAKEEKDLYEKRQTTWKWVHNQKDQDELLALYDLLPEGRMRQVERISFEIFLTLDEQHSDFKAGLPRLLKPGESRGANEIYHFLVFDPEMVPTRSDKLMKSFWKDDCETAGEWVKKQVTPKWAKEPLKDALAVCALVDQHWQNYAQERAIALSATACTATVWPIPASSSEALKPGPTLAEQERVCQELESTSGSFQRLRLAMDCWCSLWFWPLDRVGDLPTRDAFLASVRLLLSSDPPDESWIEILSAKLGFEIDVLLQASPEGQVPDTDKLADGVPWFGIASSLGNQQNFHHWELRFPEILSEHSCQQGFDLVLGNPPWILIDWNPAQAFYEIDPIHGVSATSNAELTSRRLELLGDRSAIQFYTSTYLATTGMSTYLSSHRLYAELAGMKVDLFKVFIVRAWTLLDLRGRAGLLHPEGVYDDPNGGAFRREYYPRLTTHLQFKNELRLFADVHHVKSYSINVFRGLPAEINFTTCANLYHPKTIQVSRCVGSRGIEIPGIKTPEGEWNTDGHPSRVVPIRRQELELFCRLFEDEGTPSEEARLPQVHAIELIAVLERFAAVDRRLDNSGIDFFSSVYLDETKAQRLGAITKHTNPTYQPTSPDELIISGPHFYVGCPFNRVPNTVYRVNNDYCDIDLLTIAEDFLPRSLFKPGPNFDSEQPTFPQSNERLNHSYRFVNRARAQAGNERTLIGAIIPEYVANIDAAFTTVFRDSRQLIDFAGPTFSICFDFFVKVSGKDHCRYDLLNHLPLIGGDVVSAIRRRTLRLNCLTRFYEGLWREVADASISHETWASDDKRLIDRPTKSSNETNGGEGLQVEHDWRQLSPDTWCWRTPLRSELSRRQALVEIDVLVAIALGLSLEELLTIYRVQFPVLRQYEHADEFDLYGQLLPNTVRKTPGGKELRETREEAMSTRPDAYRCRPAEDAKHPEWPFSAQPHDFPPLEVAWKIDKGRETVTKKFYPPFTRVDRIADYARAWEIFEKRIQNGGRS